MRKSTRISSGWLTDYLPVSTDFMSPFDNSVKDGELQAWSQIGCEPTKLPTTFSNGEELGTQGRA